MVYDVYDGMPTSTVYPASTRYFKLVGFKIDISYMPS